MTMGAKPLVIDDLATPQLRLLEGLHAELEDWHTPVTVWSPELEEYGSGRDVVEAVSDFKASVVELYQTLKENADHLGPYPCRQWEYLRRIVKEV